ncbi:MAG: 30S ribosomal protein S21 [Rickettsiales bacterium]|jgi:small subunit ribosomal protein S21|nr:30S ribosomal protein S21 [Rickettsiales bacterium]
MVKILVRDNNVEQALRVAKRKSQKEGLYREMKERQRYEKPTTQRKMKKEEAIRNEKRRQSKQRMVFGF